MLNSLNKRIPTTKGIFIIILSAVIAGSGILAYQYWWMPEEIEIQPQFSTKDETADWKTYRNEEYGYEIKYPEDWKFMVPRPDMFLGMKIVEFYSISEPGVANLSIVTEKEKAYNLTFEKIIEEERKKAKMNTDPQEKQIAIDDSFAISISYTECMEKLKSCRRATFIYEEDRKIEIHFANYWELGKYDKAKANRYSNIFNQMLSTFRFIEKEESYIKLFFPKGGEVLETGKAYEIKWDSKGLEKIDVGIVGGQIVGPYWTGGYIVSDIDASSGKYYWTVPSDSAYVGNYWRVFIGELPLEESGYFKVKPGEGVYDRSEGYFSIK